MFVFKRLKRGLRLMFIWLEQNDELVNLNYVRVISFDDRTNMVTLRLSDGTRTYRCTKDKYKQLALRIDSMVGVIA